jgi:hypothetical protein
MPQTNDPFFQPTPVATAAARAAVPAPRLISHLYALGDQALRSRLLARLLQPLGTLGMAAVAAGAFAGFVQRRTASGVTVALDDVSHYSSEQVLELARFVEQVDPQVLQNLAQRMSHTPLGLAALSASAAMLLWGALQRSGAGPKARPRP